MRSPFTRRPAVRDRAPHVVLVVENIPAAHDHRIRKQVHELVRAGFRITLITQREAGNTGFEQHPGVTVREYTPPPEPAGAAGYLREYLVSVLRATALLAITRLRGPVDVVQFCQPPDLYFPLFPLLRSAGARVLVDQRDLMPELFTARYPDPPRAVLALLHWLERRTARGADHVVVVNDYLHRRMCEAGADPGRLSTIFNGPVLAQLGAAEPDSRLTDGLDHLCCWVGKMGRQDRVDLLVSAIDHVVHGLGRQNCRFALIGDGECLDELRDQVARLGLERWVVFPGWLPEERVFTWLATADVGLDTSLQVEVSPVKVLEYMAAGLPVVAFDLQQTRAVSDGAAVLVAAGDLEALAGALDALLDDPGRRSALGAAGRARMRTLSWESQGRVYLGVVEALVARTGRRTGRRPALADGAGTPDGSGADHLMRPSEIA